MPILPHPPEDSQPVQSGQEADTWQHASELGNLQSELQAYATAVCGDPSSAADVVQEANMVIWEKRADFHREKEGDFRAWAFRITYFKSLAHRRDSARKGWLVFSDEMVQQIASKADSMVQGQNLRMEALQLCLTKIKPGQRKLLAHIYGTGDTVPEYASEHNASPTATYKTLQRLRKSLRDCITNALNPSA